MKRLFRSPHLLKTTALAVGLIAVAPFSHAQPQLNPVYVDDSPAADDTIARVKDHLAAGNLDEAVRVLQGLLDEHGDRLTASSGDPDVFISVRTRVHEVIRGEPALLERYRELQGPRAAALLDGAANRLDGPVDQAQGAFLLTPTGFEAALRVAQRQLEDARFEAARLTLEELDLHPDRTAIPANARAAAALYSTIARYVSRPEVWQRADRWTSDAAAAAVAHQAEPTPTNALPRAVSPLGLLPELDTRGLIAKSLWQIELTPPSSIGADMPLPNIRGAIVIPPGARELLMLPTVTDDLLVINDGTQINAWDRFTLSPRWTIQPGPVAPEMDDPDAEFRERIWSTGSSPEPITVAIRAGDGAAATGRKPTLNKEGDTQLVGFDPRTGRARWSFALAELSPLLADGVIRGPLEIHEGVVVAGVRRHAPERRLISLSMIGLDVRTGQLLWTRLVGSAGWLPFGPQSIGPEGTAVDRGIAFRADGVGAVAAVAIDSGRTLWVRRMPVEAGQSGRDASYAWNLCSPIVDDGSIIIIAPDQRRIVRLNATTGAVIAERPASLFGSPAPFYLLKAGATVAAVGPQRIAVAPIAAFDSAPVRMTPQFEEPGIWGRVSVVGDKLLVPLVKGLALVDPLNPDAEPLTQPLEKPGNILAADKQLIVVNDFQAHSYLQWEVAESILNQRMAADPKDPTPAVTFAELAYRAGRPSRIAPAIDAALTAISDNPVLERNQEQRTRLFDAVHEMVSAAIETPAPDSSADGADAARAELRIKDAAILTTLVAQLARAASNPDDKVAVALSSGRLAETAGKPAEAATIYQQVLDEPSLAVANWKGPGVSVRAELEATRRLEHLIATAGAVVYAAQETACSTTLDQLGPAATIEQLNQLATRYPLCSRVPEIYQRLSDLHKAADQPREAVVALESGLKAVQRIAGAPPAAVGELAGRLILELRERQQPSAAAGVLRSIRRRFPDIALTASGQMLDADRLGAELAERIAAATRWPRVGALTAGNMQVLSGWSLLKPRLWESTPHVSTSVVLTNEREVGVFVASPAAAEPKSDAPGGLTAFWSRPLDRGDVRHIRSTPEAVYLLFGGDSGGIEKVLLNQGPSAKGWKTGSLFELFPPDDLTRGLRRAAGVDVNEIDTPDDGPAAPDDLLAAMDERTLVLVQRTGRAVGIDLDTGEQLWRIESGLSFVYDAQLVAGMLAIAGEVRKLSPQGAVEEQTSAVQIIDARAGRLGQRIADLQSRVRWVRITESGQLICGADKSVISIDPATSQRNWMIRSPEVMPAIAAWVFGDRLLLLSSDRQLWLASLSTGQMRPQSLDAPRNRLETSRQIEAFAVGPSLDGPFAVATYQGLMTFSADGEQLGNDGLGGLDSMLPPRPAEGRAVTIETVAEGRGEDGLMQFQLYPIETPTGILEGRVMVNLGARPSAMQLLDGKILITAGASTVIIDAPAGR